MKVKDVMRRPAVYCAPDTNLAAAAELMLRHCCGCLPVVGEGGNVIGLITDRDICVALGKRDERPTHVPVWEAMQRKLFTCSPEDDVRCALKTIRRQQVRRLPVINRNGALEGILCIDDIVKTARSSAGRDEISYGDFVNAYQAITKQDAPGPTRNAMVT